MGWLAAICALAVEPVAMNAPHQRCVKSFNRQRLIGRLPPFPWGGNSGRVADGLAQKDLPARFGKNYAFPSLWRL